METVNQENQATEEATGKTFTQEELNAIVQERLTRDRAKFADYDALKEKAQKFDAMEEEKKTELQKATERAESLQAEIDRLKSENAIREARNKVAAETGVPVTLLTGSTEDECKAQAEAINAYARPASYPKVKDGGEPLKRGGTSTRDQFADWLDQSLSK